MIIIVTSGYALLPAPGSDLFRDQGRTPFLYDGAWLQLQLHGVGIRIVEVPPPLVDTPATRSVRQRKMSPETLVGRVLRDIERRRHEILPGRVGLLRC